MNETPKLIAITWREASRAAGWLTNIQAANPTETTTVGILLGETAEGLVICQSIRGNSQFENILVIPQGSVVQRVELDEKVSKEEEPSE